MANAGTVYLAKKAATIGNVGATATFFLQSENSSLAAFVGLPFTAGSVGLSSVDGKCIYVRASGNVLVGGTATTVTPIIYYSANARTQITVTGATAVAGAASPSLTGTATSYPWFVETKLVWSYSSQLLGGYYSEYFGIASGLTTQAITTGNVLTAVDLSAAAGGFVVSIQNATSSVGQVMTLSEFVLEVL